MQLNRPDKRNAMNPTMNTEMIEVLEALDADDACLVVVLTGAGDAFSAGMDLKEYFRDVDAGPAHVQRRVRRDSAQWQWRLLRTYAKPTIAMVNGWCFGGAFTPLVACDLAIAADEATFGLSEVNWGIPPGGVVSRALAETVGTRAALLAHHDRAHVRRPAGGRDGPRECERAPGASCAPRRGGWPRSCSGRTPSSCERPSSGSSTAAT